MNFNETELSLRLPGESSRRILLLSPEEENDSSSGKMGVKRGLDLNHPGTTTCESTSYDNDCGDRRSMENVDVIPTVVKPPANKTCRSEVVGWPPVRRNQAMKSRKLVKVAVDGTPYLRKVDLETFNSYRHLLSSLEDMFSGSGMSIRNYVTERAISDKAGNPMEYVPTYEDKDGDWMLVGDVPWKMFVESCKRLRLMKSSETEAVNLVPKAPSKFSSSSR